MDLDQAVRVAVDSKAQYPAACNAIETLLLHKDIAPAFLAAALPAFAKAEVELRGDPAAMALGVSQAANDDDWATEYLDLVLSIRVVESMDEALDHISRYSSRHTEVICTTNGETAERFLARVDSAGVYQNCSSRFADGFRYGFGAEVGISTQTLPPGTGGLGGWSPTAIACAVMATSPLITPVVRASSRTKTCRCERSHRCSRSAALGPCGRAGAGTPVGPVVCP